MESRLHSFCKILHLPHILAAGLGPRWESWATAIALAGSKQFAMLIRALNKQLLLPTPKLASETLSEVDPAVMSRMSDFLSFPGVVTCSEVRHLCCACKEPDDATQSSAAAEPQTAGSIWFLRLYWQCRR